MTTAIGVVGHQKRLVQAWDLSQSVDASYLSVDTGDLGARVNHMQVWQFLANGDTEWSVVLEDDAVPCDEFVSQLDMALDVAPTDIVGLYLGKSYPPAWQDFIAHVQRDEANWIQASHLLHGVGTAIRTELLPSMLDWVAKRDMPIDSAITEWCRGFARPVAYTKPSLVNHADGPTLIAHPDGVEREMQRVAWQFGTREQWRKTVVEIP